MHDRWNWHQVRLFQNLSQEQIDEILLAMPAKNVRQRDYVYRIGDTADELFILRSGSVKVFYITASGREQIIEIVQPGGGFGELFLGRGGIRLLTAQALESVEVRRLHKDALARLIRQSPHLAERFLDYITYAERQMLGRIQVLLQPVPQDRLLGILFSLASAKTQRRDVETWTVLPETVTQEDIANMAALNRSTVSVLINQLRREGILGGRGRSLSVNMQRAHTALRALGLEVEDFGC